MRKLLADSATHPPAVRSRLRSEYRKIYFQVLRELSQEAALIRQGLSQDLEAAIRFDVQSHCRLAGLWALGVLNFSGLAAIQRTAQSSVESFERFLRPAVI